MSRSSPSQKPRSSSKKVAIFDFDGVIADSFDTFYPLIKDAMAGVGIPFSKKKYKDLFLGNVHMGFKELIDNDEKYEVFKKLRNKNYDHYYHKYEPKLFNGIDDFIKKVSKNYTLAVASSGKRSNIIGLLKQNKLPEYFDMILAMNEHSKENMIKQILKKYKINPKETTMITDTVGDIKIAKKLGLKTIAVTWGFHSLKTLRKHKPTHLTSSLNNLLKFLSPHDNKLSKNKKH